MPSPLRRFLIFLILTSLSLLPAKLTACQICLPIPLKSLADKIIEAAYVSLARENPNKPFSLISVEDLKGVPAQPEIDLFLDSSTRRLLDVYPDRKIICTRLSDAPEESWQRIGTLSPELEPIVLETLKQSANWEKDPSQRLKYFSQLFGHADTQIRTLAHLEVARAPYGEIRTLKNLLPPEKVRSFLSQLRYLEWHALYIILLATSDEEQDQQLIREKMGTAIQFSFTVQLAAWATAYLEIDQGEALTFLEEHYLQNPNRSPKELKAIYQAFSAHGTGGHQHLRDRIVENYRVLLKSSPELAAAIVTDLELWQRWDLTDEITSAIPSVTDMSQVLQLRSYLQKAEEATSSSTSLESSTTDGGILAIGIFIALPVLLVVTLRLRKFFN